MVRTDETALICDMAETYGIMDWRALPLKTAAALASGLREDSRIKMKISGMPADRITLLLAAAVDRLTWLAWAKTKDGEKGRNRPESILAKLLNTGKEQERDYTVFRTPEEFEEARRKLLGGE
jgi:hypothetical protein